MQNARDQHTDLDIVQCCSCSEWSFAVPTVVTNGSSAYHTYVFRLIVLVLITIDNIPPLCYY